MHANAQQVQERLRAFGVRGDVREMPDSTRTSAEAAAAIGTTVAQIAKSLVFMAGGDAILVIASGVNRVSTGKLEQALGVKVRRADADAVRLATGYPIGGVPPIAHPSPLRTFIDRDLLQFDEIWAAAGTPHAVFPTTPDELVRVTGGVVSDVREEPA